MTRPILNRWAWPIAGLLCLPLPTGLLLFRLAFLWLYRDRFAGLSSADIVTSLLFGLRYDFSVSLAMAGVPALAILLGSPWSWRIRVLWPLFGFTTAATLVLLVLAGGDLFYFEFAGRHVSFEVRTLLSDWRPMAALAAEAYALPTVGILALMALGAGLAARAMRRLAARPYVPIPRWSHGAQVLLLIGIIGLGWRGSLGAKPLSVGEAFRGGDPILGHLALNAPFTVRVTLFGRGQQLLHFMPEPEATAATRRLLGLEGAPAEPRYPLWRNIDRPAPGRRKNLVIITIESFSAQMTGVLGGKTGATGNFDRLSKEGLLFSRFQASGTRSVEGIAAILGGYPAIPKSPVIGSALEQVSLDNLARVLGGHGYGSLFVHGAFRGSMWFDVFARRSGFRTYIAQEDFPDYRSISDGTWGIFDEYSLERLHREILAAPKPVFAFLFTLGPHTPFQLPPGRQGKFPAEAPGADMLNAFAYTDAALGRFFDLARQSDYWKNTIFVVTADHNMGKGRLNRRELMWIPLLILDPGNPDFPAGTVSPLLGGQADIAPTALDLLGLPAHVAFAGRSLIELGGKRFALHAWADQAGWQEEQWLIVHDLRSPSALYDLDADPALTANLLKSALPPSAAAALKDFQAYLQTTNNLLLQNRVLPPGATGNERTP
jgi:hypothetical protein